MKEITIPIRSELKVTWPERDLLHLSSLPTVCDFPKYEGKFDFLVGEKVYTYKFESIKGEVSIRDATLKEWNMGRKLKGVLDEY